MDMKVRGADGRLYSINNRTQIAVEETVKGQVGKAVQSGYKGDDHLAGEYNFGPPFQP